MAAPAALVEGQTETAHSAPLEIHYLLLISCNYSNWMQRGGAGMEASSRRLGELLGLKVLTPPAVPAWDHRHLLAATWREAAGCRNPSRGSKRAGAPLPFPSHHICPHRAGSTTGSAGLGKPHHCLHPASPPALLPSSSSQLGHPATHLCFVCLAMPPVIGISLLLDCYSVILFG